MTFAHHFPALQVVIPLMAAPICVILRRATAAWSLALVVSWVCLGIALTMFWQVVNEGPIVYELGGWAAPWGIEYRVDMLAALVLLIVATIGALVIVFAKSSVEKEIPSDRAYIFYSMYLLCLTGLLGMTITGDAFNLFVFLEIASLSTYVLISLGRQRQALTAAYRYLILGTIGATFYIIGVGLLYMVTGSLNMADLAQLLPNVTQTAPRTVMAALAFLTVGISLKLALFPMHQWLPNAYTFAPSVVTAFLAATATKVSVYVLLRLFFTVFHGVDVFHGMGLAPVLTGLAVLGMFVASLVAVFQNNIKRMLAYSSVAQVGYMVLGISFVSVTGLAGGIIHLFNHALMKSALFMAMGCVFLRLGSVRIRDFDGIAKRMPLTMAAFVVAGLSLIGVPLTVGFVSKWFLIRAAFEQGWWPLAVAIVLSSLLAVVYVWRVIEGAYFRPLPDHSAAVTEAPLGMLVPMWLLVGASVWFGIDASGTGAIATRAASALLGVAP